MLQAAADSAAKKEVRVCQQHSSLPIPIYLSFVLRASTAHANAYFLKCFQGDFTKIRYYTWPLLGQNHLHSKSKYKTQPRSPAIVHADIATDFGSKRPTYTCFFSTFSSFQLILANFEPIRGATYVHCCLSPHASALPRLKTFCITQRTTSVLARTRCTSKYVFT